MKLTNPKTFEKWCEKNGFRADAMLDSAERWASECDGTYGNADIYFETGRRTNYGSPETIAFDLVKPAIYKIVDENGASVGNWAANTEWTGGEECYADDEIAEALYRFRD